VIFLSAGELWAAAIGLAAAMGAAWHVAGVAFRYWRKTREPLSPPPPGHPAWRNPRAPAAAAPARPLPPGVTLHVLPCGCIYSYQRIDRDPCPPHARLVAERDEINRLDQQIRHMP
jgi:hypothetical protein